MPLLFVHGAFCAAWCWQRHFMPWFTARGFDCYALSLSGHGASEGRDWLDAASIDDYVADIAATLPRLPAPPVLIAHSMGGYVAQQLIRRHALPALVLLAPVPPAGLARSTLRLAAEAPTLLDALNRFQASPGRTDEAAEASLRELLFSPDAAIEDMRLMAARAQHESTRAIIDMQCWAPWRQWLDTSCAPPPTLVLGGGLDRIVAPEEIAGTAQALGGISEILPGAGHMLMLDADWPSACQLIVSWLQATFPATDAGDDGANAREARPPDRPTTLAEPA
nr:alpha/beta fold hydrolase [Crenobacter caeni]